MEPPDRLSQLRAQRHLVADHLAWLDREIAAATAAAAHRDPPSPVGQPPVGGLSAEPPPRPTDNPVEPASHEFTTGTAIRVQRQKWGCVALAAVGTAVLLFLIWGLPQILYPD
jgi:hypothetical protein